MGLGSELLSDYCFERDFPFGLPSDKWRTRDGRYIPLTDMTESHIMNCMNMVGEDDEWYQTFKDELSKRWAGGETGISRKEAIDELKGLVVSARYKTDRWLSPMHHKAVLYAIQVLTDIDKK